MNKVKRGKENDAINAIAGKRQMPKN